MQIDRIQTKIHEIHFLFLIFLIIPVLSFSQSWMQKTSIYNYGRYSASGFVIGDSVMYIGTGTYGNSGYCLYDFLEYNRGTNTWTPMEPQDDAIPRNAGIGFSIGDVGYYGTGYSDDNFFANFWAFDNKANENEKECDCETDFDLYFIVSFKALT